MKKIFIKILFCVSVFLLLETANVYAQDSDNLLQLGVPLESKIASGKESKFFRIQLSANQTAKIEVNQKEVDVSLVSYDTKGKKMLEWGLSLGRFGSESMLILAEEIGEYKIEVKPGHRHVRPGKFTVKLTELRDTTEKDRLQDNAAKEISRIKPEAYRYFRLGIGSSRQKSVELWSEVARLARIKEDKLMEARALHANGSTYYFLNEIQKAIENNLQVLAMWRELKNRRYEMIVVGRTGNVWRQLGEPEKAIASYQEARKIAEEIKSRFEFANATHALGTTYLEMGQPQTAIKHFEEALAKFVEMKVAIRQAQVLTGIGKAYLAIGDIPKGVNYLNRGLTLHRKLGYREGIALTNINLATPYRQTGKIDKAMSGLQEARLITAEIGSKTPLIQSLYQIALINSERGNLNDAIKNLEDGLKVIEQIRGKIRNQNFRTSYFATVQRFYELYTDLLIERSEKNNDSSDISLAFEMSERSRSRSLIDLLTEAKIDLKRGVSPKLIEKEGDLADTLNLKLRTRERLLRRKTTKPEQLEKVNSEINNLELELEKISLQIRNESPQYANLTRGKTLSTKEIQNLLDNETVLLEYKLGKKRSHLWLVTNNSIKYLDLPNSGEIYSEARTFYQEVVRNGTDYIDGVEREQLQKRLYNVLLGKVKNEIKGKRLAIVADGMLQYLPFSALQSLDGKYLADTNETIVLPSASVLSQIRTNSSKSIQNNKSIAVFADPVFDKEDSRINGQTQTLAVEMQRVTRDFRFDKTLPRLLASRREARNIFRVADKKESLFLTDFDASVKNIETANLKSYRILHFATHGLLNTTNPELSGLVFSLYDKKGKTQDGFLSLNDIYNLELSSDMVVLSACQTALGKEVRGEGLIGISRGFLYAGSKRIVASLWKVDDSATAEFMKRFYKNHLNKGMPASKALQQTKIEMKKIRRYSSPYYWSAFTLLGDWK